MYKGNVIEEFDEFIDPPSSVSLYDPIDRDYQYMSVGLSPGKKLEGVSGLL